MIPDLLNSLYAPLSCALLSLNQKWKKEPEYILIGLIPSSIIQPSRHHTIKNYGIHYYHHLISASILDPDFVQNHANQARFEFLCSPGFYAAVHLNAFPQASGLPLYLTYLSRFPELSPGDYYDLLGHWFSAKTMVQLLSELFFLSLHHKTSCDPEIVLKILSCEMYRTRVDWEEMEHRWITSVLEYDGEVPHSSSLVQFPFQKPC